MRDGRESPSTSGAISSLRSKSALLGNDMLENERKEAVNSKKWRRRLWAGRWCVCGSFVRSEMRDLMEVLIEVAGPNF